MVSSVKHDCSITTQAAVDEANSHPAAILHSDGWRAIFNIIVTAAGCTLRRSKPVQKAAATKANSTRGVLPAILVVVPLSCHHPQASTTKNGRGHPLVTALEQQKKKKKKWLAILTAAVCMSSRTVPRKRKLDRKRRNTYYVSRWDYEKSKTTSNGCRAPPSATNVV